MKVEIWSDVVCPWCYIGKRRFEAALARFPHRDEVEVEWKAFELDPTSTSVGPDAPHSPDAHLVKIAAKFGSDVEQVRGMMATMTATAAAEGLDFHFDQVRAANTILAHQVIHLGGERGIQDAVKERLMRAYFTEGAAVGDPETLIGLAVEAGLEEVEVRQVLADQTYLDAVQRDIAEARALGISGVPFFVIERKYGVSGAQPADALLQVLEQVWTESHPAPTLTPVGGPADACGPDGCPVP
jgi:predicted DsbA family dithiol-disulfide isomerase